MPQIRIILVEYGYDDCGYESSHDILESITDWEEITDEELSLLRQYRYDVIKSAHGIPVILVKDPEPVSYRVNNLRETIEQIRLKKEKENRKRREKAAEKKEKDAERIKQKELATLRKLKEKYGET